VQLCKARAPPYRLTGTRLKEEFELHGETLYILLRYTQSLLAQMAQTAVCNRHHTVDQELCRWLLLSLDLLPSEELVVTQELIAKMAWSRTNGGTSKCRTGILPQGREIAGPR